MRKVFLAADHGGYDLKEKIKKELFLKSQALRLEVEDLGTHSEASVDYPDSAAEVCKRIHGFHLVPDLKIEGAPPAAPISLPLEVGILVCGSGQGMAMSANKFSHIRAALCWNEESTQLSREHNDANVLCLGGRLIEHPLALKMLEIFLNTHFAGDRHLRRVLKMSKLAGTSQGET